MILQKNKNEFQFLNQFKRIPKLSTVRKVPEMLFQALGIIETLGSIISHGTSKKFADVRTHLRKVFNMTLSSIWVSLKQARIFVSHETKNFQHSHCWKFFRISPLHIFLDYMGINSLEELPIVEETELIAEESQLFTERIEDENQ